MAGSVWNHQTRTKSSQIIAHHRRRPPNELNEILHEQNLVVKFCGRLDSRVVLVAFIDLTGRANVLLTELTLACRPTFNQRENKISFFLLLRLFALIANKQGWWRRRWLGDVASLDSVPVLLPSPSRSQFLLSNQFANWNLRNSPSSLSDRATGRASECQSCYHHYYSVCVAVDSRLNLESLAARGRVCIVSSSGRRTWEQVLNIIDSSFGHLHTDRPRASFHHSLWEASRNWPQLVIFKPKQCWTTKFPLEKR